MLWVTAAVGPEGKCEAGKNQESGKYAFRLHKAEAKLLKTKGACSVNTETDCYRDEDCPMMGESCNKDTTKYIEAVTKCENKYAEKWNTLETKAAEECGNGVVDAGEDCDQGDLDGESCVSRSFAGGTLACGPGCAFDIGGCYAVRFADNSDGTITDNETGLEWEKKVKLNSEADPANLQDADNVYRWSGTCSVLTSKRCQPNATASAACSAGVEGNSDGCVECTGGKGVCTVGSPGVTVWQWLADLNTARFGGHADWRIAKKAELETLLKLNFTTWTPPVIDSAFHGVSCGVACTNVANPACACTRSNDYWSASTYAPDPSGAWGVNFNDGNVNANNKWNNSLAVRAVRGGS